MHNYYSDYGNDSIQPIRGVTYHMLDEYIKKRVNKEIDRLTDLIEKKITNITTNSLTELRNVKHEVKLLKERRSNKKEKGDKTIADTFTPDDKDEEDLPVHVEEDGA